MIFTCGEFFAVKWRVNGKLEVGPTGEGSATPNLIK